MDGNEKHVVTNSWRRPAAITLRGARERNNIFYMIFC